MKKSFECFCQFENSCFILHFKDFKENNKLENVFGKKNLIVLGRAVKPVYNETTNIRIYILLGKFKVRGNKILYLYA